MAARVTATKKAAAKRPAAKPKAPAPPPEPEVLEPSSGFEVLRLTTRKDKAEERVPLFYIDDREYTIPRRPRMNVALEFMHFAREQGDSRAMDFLLEKLLGKDGYQALRDYDQLEPEQFQQITAIATRLTLGALELPKE